MLERSCLYLFVYLSFSRATPAAYGGSQARGRIGALAAGLCHSHSKPDLSHVCDLHSSWQRQIIDPLTEARDQTHDLMVPSRSRLCCAMMATLRDHVLIIISKASAPDSFETMSIFEDLINPVNIFPSNTHTHTHTHKTILHAFWGMHFKGIHRLL